MMLGAGRFAGGAPARCIMLAAGVVVFVVEHCPARKADVPNLAAAVGAGVLAARPPLLARVAAMRGPVYL